MARPRNPKTFKPSPKHNYSWAKADLDQLRNSLTFRQAVLACKGNSTGRVQELCYRFLIADTDWMCHVIESWDGKAPLPRTDSPKIWRPLLNPPRKGDFDPLVLGIYKGNFFSVLEGFRGGESEYLSGSPRLRKQSVYQRDASGAEWMTLRIRLTPGLTKAQLGWWARGALKDCMAKSKKPSAENLVIDLLNEQFKRKPTIYQAAQYIVKECAQQLSEHGFSVKDSQAKAYVRKWLSTK